MKLTREETTEVPIAPLIDVVFLLIIFFVVTTNLQQDVIDYSVKLAKSTHIPPLQDGPPPGAITINVRYNGEDNTPLYILGGSRFTTRQIDGLLRVAKQKFGTELPIILRTDGRIKYKEIQKLNDVIGKVGLYRVSHSAEDSSSY